MATRDASGKFVKTEEEEELLEVAEEAPSTMPPLRLQSRFKRHTVMITPTRRIFHPTLGIEVVPGAVVKFEGPQRIFDSEYAQKKNGWDDATRDRIERKLVQHKGFMSDYWPAPMSAVPEHLAAIARVKPPSKKRICEEFGWDEGVLTQCGNEAMAGSRYCRTHDRDQTRIIQGGGTTIG